MKKSAALCTVFLLFILLTGCGKKDAALEQYKSDMTEFTATIDGLVTAIDNIDLESDTRASEMLEYLDEMENAFAEMADWEVPQQFANIEELADEASANLSQAVSLYHEAFDDEENYDPQLIDAALEYYNRAFKRLNYIGTILQGELPEDDSITIIHGDEQEPESDEPESSEPEEDVSEEEDAAG